MSSKANYTTFILNEFFLAGLLFCYSNILNNYLKVHLKTILTLSNVTSALKGFGEHPRAVHATIISVGKQYIFISPSLECGRDNAIVIVPI